MPFGYEYEKQQCSNCGGTGRLKGTRETARGGRCGTRRGTVLKECQECNGKGFWEVRIARAKAALESGKEW